MSIAPATFHRPAYCLPGGVPIAGHFFEFYRDRLNFLLRIAKIDEPVIRFRLDEPIYLVTDVNDIKHVMEGNYTNYDKTRRLTSTRGRNLLGGGVLTATGDDHLRKRRAVQPVFAQSSLSPFVDTMAAMAADTFQRWRDGDELNIHQELMSLAQRIIGRMLFSIDYRDEAPELARAFAVRRDFVQHMFSWLLPRPEKWPVSAVRLYPAAWKTIETTLDKFIADRRREPDRYNDMLAKLMHAHYEDDAPLTDEEVFDEALVTGITGYETIGEALAWTSYLLTQHPEIEQKTAAELQTVLGNRLPTLTDVPKLTYLPKVIAESMRLYPPTWIIPRVSREADHFPSGVDIPAQARLYICPWVNHHNEQLFPDPNRFDPERFSEANRKNRPKYAYFPFGGGPRVCIGQALAKLENTIVLACLLQRFKLQLIPGQQIIPEAGITLHPRNGIRIRLSRRNATPFTTVPRVA